MNNSFFCNVRKTYSNLTVQVKAMVWFTICSFLQKGISFIVVPIFTRVLSTEEYGVYSLFQTWYSFIEIFATLMLIGGVYNKGLIRYSNKKNEFTSSMLGLSSTSTLIVFLIYIFFKDSWNQFFNIDSDKVTIVICIIFLQLFFSQAFSFWTVQQRFHYKYIALIVVTLLVAVISPILELYVVYNTNFYRGEARTITAASVKVVVGVIFYIIILMKGKKLFDSEIWLYALRFNIPLIPHYISKIILAQSDRVMINMFCGADKAGIYSIAYSLAMIMNILTESINNTCIPWTYQKLNQKQEKDIGKIVNGILVLIAVPVIGIIAFAPEIIKIFAPPEYLEAIWIIPPLAICVYLIFVYTLFVNIEFFYEETRFIMIASSVAAIGNIVLNYIFIPTFGFCAASYTSMVCYIILCVAHYLCMRYIMKKNEQKNPIYDVKNIIFITIGLMCISISLVCTYNNIVLRYILIVLCIFTVGIERRRIIDRIRQMYYETKKRN